MAATKEANKICQETGKTMLIYFYQGEYRYVAKQDMKKAGLSGKEAEAIAHGKIVRFMKPKEEKPKPAPKLDPQQVKKLQEETKTKQGKIVTK